MDMERSLTADEAMDIGRSLSLTFTIDNGVEQSAGGSLIWLLRLPSGQYNLEEEEEDDDDDDESAVFFDRPNDDGQDDDDVAAYQFDDSEFGYYPAEEIVVLGGDIDETEMMISIDILAQRLGFDFETVVRHMHPVFGEGAHGSDGVPASDAAVAGLEKLAFHLTEKGRDDDCECGGGVTGCAICLEDFDDGEEVTVMPCSSGHEFHPDCITKWLGKNNTCPLCRHALPTDVVDDDDGL